MAYVETLSQSLGLGLKPGPLLSGSVDITLENSVKTLSVACVCENQTQGSSFLRAALYECCCVTVPWYMPLCSVHFSVCLSVFFKSCFTYSPASCSA